MSTDSFFQPGEAAEFLLVRAAARAIRGNFDPFLRGHEGKGSVLALLKVKGWAQELSAGFSYVNTTVSIFVLSNFAADTR